MVRTFIIEPSLILEAGHVKKCTELFTQESLKLNDNTQVIVPISAPDLLSKKSNILVRRILPDSYQEMLYKSELMAPNYTVYFIARTFFFFLGKHRRKRIEELLIRISWLGKNRLKMRRAIKELFSLEGISSRDKLVFPNGDLLCLGVVLQLMNQMGPLMAPKISIRFINVMENSGLPKIYTRRVLFMKIARMQRKKFKIKVSAETENYRLHLARYIPETFITEYPHIVKAKRSNKSNEIKIGILGSARPDKGFEELNQIIPLVQSSNLGNRTSFLVQEATHSWSLRYDEVMYSLRQFSKVALLPGYISDSQMEQAISSCSYLLLPYDSNVYRYRGSAMLFDAADLKIPIIAPAGTGMGTVIRRFGIGATYSNSLEIPAAILYLSKLKQSEINERFDTYNSFRNFSIKKFFE